MDNYLALLDNNTEYVRKLASYMEKKSSLPFKILPFDNSRKLEHYFQDSPAEVIVAGDNYDEKMLRSHAKQVIFLSDSANESLVAGSGAAPIITKYQPAPVIVNKIMDIVVASPIEVMTRPVSAGNSNTKLIGFFTPGYKNQQTTAALSLCRSLGEKSKVLYLGFEPFSCFDQRLGINTDNDVTDLIYFLDKTPEKFRIKLSGMVVNKNGADHIYPPSEYTDLISISPEEWIEVLNRLTSIGSYAYIVADLNESMQGLFAVISMCHHVIAVPGSDRLFSNKLDRFISSWKKTLGFDPGNKIKIYEKESDLISEIIND